MTNHHAQLSGAATAPLRLRDKVFVPRPVRDHSLLTGFTPRDKQLLTYDLEDPSSGEQIPLVVAHYPAKHSQPGNPVMVMVHGFRGDHHGLQLVVDALPEFEIWVPDLPGFGLSPAFPDVAHDVSSYAQIINQFAQHIGQRQSRFLVGHSFGSMITSEAIAQDRSLWDGLVLLAPISRPALDPHGGLFQRLATSVTDRFYRVCASVPAAAGRWLLSHPVLIWATGAFMSKTDDVRTLAYTHDQHRQYFSAFDTPQALLDSYRASVAETVTEKAHLLCLPVLVVSGDQDELASVAEQEHLVQQISAVSPHSRLNVIPGTGHLLHYEVPVEIAAGIRGFVDELAEN